jgi:FAD/FMN-containing dehydrogenase
MTTRMTPWHAEVPRLAERISGPLFTVETPGYDDEVAGYNRAIVHRPDIVVGAAGPLDVCEAVAFAAGHGLAVGILNTGHGPAVAAGPGTLLITTKRMTTVDIDTSTSTARVAAGVQFGQLVAAAAGHGLAPLPGSSPGVGVVGYTISGGASATMGRLHGWAADHVSAFDIVTADGRLRRVTPTSEPALFGAVLGGKSNFGVVTAIECRLFPVTRLYAGSLYFPGAHARDVLRAYRRFTVIAPDEITTGAALLNFPQAEPIVALRISHVGDADAAERLIRPLRRAAPLVMDTVADIPYGEFASISADPSDPAAAVEYFGLLGAFTDETVDAVVGVAGPAAGGRVNIFDIRHLGGGYRRAPRYPNAIGARDAAFAYFALTMVMPGEQIADHRESGREIVTALAPWTHAMGSPTFQGPADATVAGTRRAYDADTYERLRRVKSEVDPHNIFRINHNIPAAP